MQTFLRAPLDPAVPPSRPCDKLDRRDVVKHTDIDGQALIWCVETASKTVALAQPSALCALPANVIAGVWRRARTREGRSPLPRAGCRARARFLRGCPFALRPMCHTHCPCYSMSRQSVQQCRCSWATPESPKHTAAASDHVRVRPKALEPREQRSSERAASGAMRLSRDGAALSYSATRRRTARVRVNLGARRRSLAFWTSPARATHAPQRVRGDRWAW